MNNNPYDQAVLKAQEAAIRLKAYFPYRICWYAVHPESCEYETGATPTRRQPNDMARKGWDVFVVG
jgi:hypothetical protein